MFTVVGKCPLLLFISQALSINTSLSFLSGTEISISLLPTAPGSFFCFHSIVSQQSSVGGASPCAGDSGLFEPRRTDPSCLRTAAAAAPIQILSSTPVHYPALPVHCPHSDTLHFPSSYSAHADTLYEQLPLHWNCTLSLLKQIPCSVHATTPALFGWQGFFC